MIKLNRVTFGYSSHALIFEEFSWEIARGESWSVLGASGCGKTTLFYLLAGLREADSGKIYINEEVLHKPRPQTGLIFQDYGLLPWATVQENVILGYRIRKFYGSYDKHVPLGQDLTDVEQAGRFWMQKLGLDEIGEKYPSQISGGQRQRTAIARTLSLNPDLLLMDEPFASLDVPTRENLQKFIISLREEKKMTNIIVTHSIEEAALMGKKILVFKSVPHRSPLIIENKSAGSLEYIQSQEYIQMCLNLRKKLEEQ